MKVLRMQQPQAQWQCITVYDLGPPTWRVGEEEEEVTGEVAGGRIVVLENVQQYWHTAKVSHHHTRMGTLADVDECTEGTLEGDQLPRGEQLHQGHMHILTHQPVTIAT